VAGDSATKRGINLAQAQEFDIKVIVLSEGLDPADAVLKDQGLWEKSLKSAKTILDFYFDTTFSRFDKTSPEGKKDISKILLLIIKRIPNRIVQSHWINRLSEELRVKEEDIEEELNKIERAEDYSGPLGIEEEEIKNLPVKTRKELLEERFVAMLFKMPDFLKDFELERCSMFSDCFKEIILKLKENPKVDSKSFNPDVSEIFNLIALKSEIEEMEDKDVLSELQYCLSEIDSIILKNKLDQISNDIKTAEIDKDQNKIEELTEKFNKLIKGKCQS